MSRSIDGLPDNFGTQVNILADGEDIKFYNQGFCKLSLIFTDILLHEPIPRREINHAFFKA